MRKWVHRGFPVTILVVVWGFVAHQLSERDGPSQSHRRPNDGKVPLPFEIELPTAPPVSDLNRSGGQMKAVRSRLLDIRSSKAGIGEIEAVIEFLVKAYADVSEDNLIEFFDLVGEELDPDRALGLQMSIISKLLIIDPESAASLLESIGSSGADLRILEIAGNQMNRTGAESLLKNLDGAKWRAFATGYSIALAKNDLEPPSNLRKAFSPNIVKPLLYLNALPMKPSQTLLI